MLSMPSVVTNGASPIARDQQAVDQADQRARRRGRQNTDRIITAPGTAASAGWRRGSANKSAVMIADSAIDRADREVDAAGDDDQRRAQRDDGDIGEIRQHIAEIAKGQKDRRRWPSIAMISRISAKVT